MKTITGKILSSKTVPVARARSFLSEFVDTDTGASQAVGAYLRRATAAFDELLRAHSKSQRRREGDEGAASGDGDDKVSLVNNGGLKGGRVGEVKEEVGKGRLGVSRGSKGKVVIEVKEEDVFGDGKKAKKKKREREREREKGSLEENGSVVRNREGGIEGEAKRDGEVKREDGEERRLKRKSGGGEEEKEEVGSEERKQSKKKKKRRKGCEDDH